MSKQFFLQMSGVPGSGKTTVANAIAKQTGAIIIDHDVVKYALIDSTVPGPLAGKSAYKILHGMAFHLLGQGHSVIFDSPCHYEDVLEQGQLMAQYYKALYLFIECKIDDLIEIDRRLRTRIRYPSQLSSVWEEPAGPSGKGASGESLFKIWMNNMQRPESDFLILDTSYPLKKTIREALTYVRGSLSDTLDFKSSEFYEDVFDELEEEEVESIETIFDEIEFEGGAHLHEDGAVAHHEIEDEAYVDIFDELQDSELLDDILDSIDESQALEKVSMEEKPLIEMPTTNKNGSWLQALPGESAKRFRKIWPQFMK